MRAHTHTFAQMFTHYSIAHTDFTVSHDCLLQTIRAESDLLQHLRVSHYLSVIPHPPPPPHPHLLLLALLRSAPFLIVAFFVCTLFLANLFLVISLPPLPFSSSLLCCRFSFLIFTVCFSSVFFPSATEHAVSLLSLSPPILHPS